jgi:ABC-type sugar transport system permease subunit
LSAATTPPTIPAKAFRGRFRLLHLQEHLTGYLFILPAVVVIAVFGLFPIGYAFYMSLHRWRVRQGGFLGLANYEKALGDWGGVLVFVAGFGLLLAAYWLWNSAFRSDNNRWLVGKLLAAFVLLGSGLAINLGWSGMMASGDQNFLHSLPITLFYALGTVPAEILVALVLAYILFQQIRGQEFFRMIYFLPYVTPVVATAVVFRTIFSPRETSLSNQMLSWLGISPKSWLFEPNSFLQALFGLPSDAGPSLALVAIILFGIWTYIGYNTVIFLAGLGSIPRELYEAAEIDGAGNWQLFRRITLPLLSPVTFYLSIIAFIGTLKAFNHIYVMRVPSAQGTVDTTSIVIFDTFYKANQYGYATSQAIILFLIILALTLFQNKVFGEKVFYG